MPDWTGFLDKLAGGAFGITKGLTAGAEPYKAWDAVAASGLANEKSALSLRDQQLLQQALENPELDFYGNVATAKNTANKVATSKGNLDIFGNERNLDINQQLADPMGMFQQAVQDAGLTPADPEYRILLSQFLGYQDPMGATKAYDSFGVDKMQQRNANQQAALGMVLAVAQMNDPGATILRKPDGTLVVRASDGEEVEISGDMLVKYAAMSGGATPADAIYKGFQSEQGIQNTNINLLKALEARGITPQKALVELKQMRVGYDKDISDAQRELAAIEKDTLLDPEVKAPRVAEAQARLQQARAQKAKVMTLYAQVAATSRLPGTEAPRPTPRVAPTGGTKVTTRPPPQSAAARAAGMPMTGGIQLNPVTGMPMGGAASNSGYDLFGIETDPLGQFIQSLGIQ